MAKNNKKDLGPKAKKPNRGKRILNLVCSLTLVIGLVASSFGAWGYLEHFPSEAEAAVQDAIVSESTAPAADLESTEVTAQVENPFNNQWIDGGYTLSSISSVNDALDSLTYLDIVLEEDLDFSSSSSEEVGELDFYRFDQTYEGVPVYGRTATVIVDGDDEAAGLNTNSVAIGELETDAAVDRSDAQDAAEQHLIETMGCSEEHVAINDYELTVFTLTEEPVLCWQIEASGVIENENDFVLVSQTIFIDAQSGELVAAIDESSEYQGQDGSDYEVPTFSSGNTEYLGDTERRIYVHSLGFANKWPWNKNMSFPTGRSEPAPTSNAAAVDALYNVIATYDFFNDYFERQGLDGRGSELNVYVDEYGENLNAYFSYGTGISFVSPGNDTEQYSSNLDVVAHEYTHGVTRYTSNLLGKLYINGTWTVLPAAGINENLSDIFGETVEKAVTGQTDWQNAVRVFAEGKDEELIDNQEEHASGHALDYIAYLIGTGQELEGFSKEETRFFDSSVKGGSEGLEEWSLFWHSVQVSLNPTSDFQHYADTALGIAWHMYEEGSITEAQYEGIVAAFNERGLSASESTEEDPESTSTTFATALVFDTSGSMSDSLSSGDGTGNAMTKLEAAKEAGRALITQITMTEKRYSNEFSLSVTEFNSDADLVTRPTLDFDLVASGIDSLSSDGGTNICSGLEVGVMQLDGYTDSRAIILLSDGQDGNREETLEMAASAAERDIVIYTIGFGDPGSLDEDLLKEIASMTGGTYSYASADNAVSLVAGFMRSQADITSNIVGEELGTVSEGSSTPAYDFKVPESTGDLSAMLYWPGSTLDTILYDPDGIEVTEDYYGATFDTSAIPTEIVITDPKPGSWSLSVYGAKTSVEEEPYYSLVSFREIERGKTEPLTGPMLASAIVLPIGLFMVIVSLGVLIVSNRKAKR